MIAFSLQQVSISLLTIFIYTRFAVYFHTRNIMVIRLYFNVDFTLWQTLFISITHKVLVMKWSTTNSIIWWRRDVCCWINIFCQITVIILPSTTIIKFFVCVESRTDCFHGVPIPRRSSIPKLNMRILNYRHSWFFMYCLF